MEADKMNGNKDYLSHVIVGLADLIREVKLHGRTARFDMRAPGLLEEAIQAVKQGAATPAETATARRRNRRCAMARMGAGKHIVQGALDTPSLA